jgi:hypothetical protein
MTVTLLAVSNKFISRKLAVTIISSISLAEIIAGNNEIIRINSDLKCRRVLVKRKTFFTK